MIELVARGKCDRCAMYVPTELAPPNVTARASRLFAMEALSATEILVQAVRRGWSAYPLLCPDCAAKLTASLKVGADEQQDRGTVREAGEDPQ